MAMFGGMDPFILGMIVAVIISLFSLIPALFFPMLAFIPSGLASIISLVGSAWFLILVFQEDTNAGIMCLCIPCYSFIYLLQNFDMLKRPFFVQLLGIFLSIAAAVITGFQH